MFKQLMMATLLVCSAVAPGFAKNLAVPAKDPVATLVIPDSWKPEKIDFGYAGMSPDRGVFFSVEYATAARLDKMFALNDQWMKENKIKPKGEPTEMEITLNGLPATLFTYQAIDENGDTEIDFVLIPAGKRIIMLTLWGSQKEQQANKKDLDVIKNSVKPIN